MTFWTRLRSVDSPDLGGFPQKVVLARATTANLTNYSAWEFLKSSFSFQAGAPTSPSQMWNVANYPAKHFSVDRITINGTSAWIMVHSWWFFGIKLVLRRSEDGWAGLFWYDYGESPDQYTMIKGIGEAGGVDPPCGDEAYHQTAHWHLSDQVNKKLLMGYYCSWVDHPNPGENVSPWECNPGGTYPYRRGVWGDPEQAQWTGLVGRIRYYNQDLLKIRPWCTSGCDTP